MSAPNQVSFLPDDYLARKAQQRTNIICAMLFLIVMVTIGFAFTITEKSTREVDRQHADIDKQYAEAAKRIEQVKQLNEKQRRMAHQAELTASLLEKVPRSFLLAEITNSMPAGVSLLDYSMDSKLRKAAAAQTSKSAFEAKKAALASKRKSSKEPDAGASLIPAAEAKLYDVTMKITGIASTDVQVAQFIRKLSQSTLLKDVNLVISDQHKQDDEVLRRFQIEAMLHPDASVDANAPKPTETTAVPVES